MRRLNFIFYARLLALFALYSTQPAFSHGYVSSPQSRSFLCNQGGNVNCGAVQYEPQSVEGPDGYPAGGAQDGTLAAAGSPAWASLNEQTANRWKKIPLKSGRNSFTWHFTAPHVTKNFVYYITKSDWDPNKALTRASFEAAPFCALELNAKPPFDFTHECVVPERQGYHVILALWDVGDTAATFYNVLDVEINATNGNGGVTPPAAPGTAKPTPVPPATPTTPTAPGRPGAHCNDSGSKVCQAKAGSGATDSWCNSNCNHNPSFCPTNLCSCEGTSALVPDAPGAGSAVKKCVALPTGGADQQWCQINCNHNPSFCPTTLCRCE